MKISDIYRNYFGKMFDGELAPERRVGAIGPRCAELIARCGVVHYDANYKTGSTNELRGLRYVESQRAEAKFVDGVWHIECAGEHAAYAVWDSRFVFVDKNVFHASTLFPGNWTRTTWTAWQLADTDVDVDVATIEAAIKADNDMARDAVVWRPRPNQFVIRIVGHEGTCLDPDGREWTFAANNAVMQTLADAVGVPLERLPMALANDKVVGRSRYTAKGQYYCKYSGTFSPEELERVVGFATMRRIRRAQPNLTA